MSDTIAPTITPRIDFARELAGLYDLRGQVAFLPGGYGGIGEAITWVLALAGASVMIGGRSAVKAEALVESLRQANYSANCVAMDVQSITDIRTATDATIDAFGRLDILVNCVGIQREEPLLDVTENAYDEVYRVNLKAAMFIAQAAARRQIAGKRGGRQLHLLSVRSQLGLRNRGYSAYCSTKGALVMLVKQHAMELAPERITVNGIAPTFVYTELIRHVMENAAFRQQLLERIPLGRIADPKDVAGPALFFCAPASGFVTGQVLYVDGGITASQ
ncbi:MAG TPA: SDR family oxidoreductase [Casimicrobiaceae bacterium]|jgi:gluconate 5-dehydrogenase